MAPPATVATTPDDFDGLNLDGIAVSSPSIPRNLGATIPKPVPKDTPLNEKLRYHENLANLGWDRTAKSFYLPELTENRKWIYRSPDRASINEAMANMLTNIPEALAQSTDFLHCEVGLTHHYPLVCAQYATSCYESMTIQSIALTGESKKHFPYFYLVLDSKSLAEECESASYNRKAEELLSEAKVNLSKVKMTITTSTAIIAVHHLGAYLANICAILKAQLVCDMLLKDIHTPAIFVVARIFALHLLSASMRYYLKKSNRPHKPLVLWTVQMLEQLSILLTHPLLYAKNAFLVANERLFEVALDKFIKAFKILDNCVSTLRKFECRTGTIPSCPLLQEDKAKAAKAKLEKAPKHTAGHDHTGTGLVTPDTKCQQGSKPGDVTPSSEDLNGALIYSGTDMMPTVNESNLSLRLCAARQCVGRHCPRSALCMMIHHRDVTKWTDTTFAK